MTYRVDESTQVVREGHKQTFKNVSQVCEVSRNEIYVRTWLSYVATSCFLRRQDLPGRLATQGALSGKVKIPTETILSSFCQQTRIVHHFISFHTVIY